MKTTEQCLRSQTFVLSTLAMVCKQFEPGSDDRKHFRVKFLPGLNHLNEVLT